MSTVSVASQVVDLMINQANSDLNDPEWRKEHDFNVPEGFSLSSIDDFAVVQTGYNEVLDVVNFHAWFVVDSRAARLDWELTKDAFTDEGFAYWTENYPAVDFESEDVVGLEK